MELNRTGFTSIEQVTGQYLNSPVQNGEPDSQVSFEEILKGKYNDSDVKFSKHASLRLSERNISLTEEQMDRLNKGVQLSSSKGIKESLVLMDNLSFIVNTQNNTVVTAMQQETKGENIYTNIDGAVLV